MPRFAMGDAVDVDFVHTEVAHRIHVARHKGDNYFCRSDAQLAEEVMVLFHEKGWLIMAQPQVVAVT